MGAEITKVSKRQLEQEVYRLTLELADLRRGAQGDDLTLMAMEGKERVLERSCGYFREGRDLRTGLFWVRFKWTDGPLRERYQFGSGETLALATMCVLDKVEQVEAGKLKASLDSPPKRR